METTQPTLHLVARRDSLVRPARPSLVRPARPSLVRPARPSLVRPARPSLVVHPARPDDLPRLEALLDRCTDETRYRRFHGAVGSAVDRELWRIAHPSRRHRSWVVVADGDVRGTATLAWGRDGDPEAAFLVEDAWFRRGLGRMLFGAIAEEARRRHVSQVDAWILADNHPVREFLRSVAPHAETQFAGSGELVVHIPVTVGSASGAARTLGATA